MRYEIAEIFPTAVMVTEFGRDFTEEELNYFKQISNSTVENVGNLRSKYSYVLEEEPLKDIKKICLEAINSYMNDVYNPENKLTPYITQSWLNFTETEGYHHSHSHPNSFISGILYINADHANDTVSFYKDRTNIIKLYPKQFNKFNSDSIKLAVKTGLIVIFPSDLTHDVKSKKGNNTRTSLAFNSFFKGKIGNEYKTDELTL